MINEEHQPPAEKRTSRFSGLKALVRKMFAPYQALEARLLEKKAKQLPDPPQINPKDFRQDFASIDKKNLVPEKPSERIDRRLFLKYTALLGLSSVLANLLLQWKEGNLTPDPEMSDAETSLEALQYLDQEHLLKTFADMMQNPVSALDFATSYVQQVKLIQQYPSSEVPQLHIYVAARNSLSFPPHSQDDVQENPFALRPALDAAGAANVHVAREHISSRQSQNPEDYRVKMSFGDIYLQPILNVTETETQAKARLSAQVAQKWQELIAFREQNPQETLTGVIEVVRIWRFFDVSANKKLTEELLKLFNTNVINQPVEINMSVVADNQASWKSSHGEVETNLERYTVSYVVWVNGSSFELTKQTLITSEGKKDIFIGGANSLHDTSPDMKEKFELIEQLMKTKPTHQSSPP